MAAQPYDPAAYGQRHADTYDRIYESSFATDFAVGPLSRLAPQGDGSGLDLGTGPGRLALPLPQAGFAVQGVEASPAMIAALRARPGGSDIAVFQGDLADFALSDTFAVVVCAVSTLFMLPDRETQVSGL